MPIAKLKFIDEGDKAALYSITFDEKNLSEFESFIERYKNHSGVREDYAIIIKALSKIMNSGAQERRFRPEGKMRDRVFALPIERGKLRLYCVRISDSVVIIGNGGIKNTATYQESEELNGHVLSLQKFDQLLRLAERHGKIQFEEKNILELEDNTYIL